MQIPNDMSDYHPDARAKVDDNAHLIAAAPDLLAACEQAYSLIGPQQTGPSLEVSLLLGDAIKKARGE